MRLAMFHNWATKSVSSVYIILRDCAQLSACSHIDEAHTSLPPKGISPASFVSNMRNTRWGGELNKLCIPSSPSAGGSFGNAKMGGVIDVS